MVNWGKIIFGGVDSSDYGIYITGEGVYNAPERVVEFVSAPGRDGDIAIDQGRFSNIRITYPSGTFGKTQEEFREAVSSFRNAILSLRGYQRLEDTYHPDEYRMAVYTAGLEVSPAHYGTAGEFGITFECKPQRWLVCGENPIPIATGDVLQNPSLFDASPLLEIEGYGGINFNGYSVTLENSVLGDVSLVGPFSFTGRMSITKRFEIDSAYYNSLDVLSVKNIVFTPTINFNGTLSSGSVDMDGSSEYSPVVQVGGTSYDNNSFTTNIDYSCDIPLPSNNEALEVQTWFQADYTVTVNSVSKSFSVYAEVTASHASSSPSDPIYVIVKMTVTYNTSDSAFRMNELYIKSNNDMTVYSTISLLGHPTYVDCDLGEAYKIDGDTLITLNHKIDLGSDLPTLAPGQNRITFDNTITDLKIRPRWWKV